MNPQQTPIARLALAGAAVVGLVAAASGTAIAHEEQPAATGASALHSRDGAGAQLAALRTALAPYRDVSVAVADGFVPVSECTTGPDGGMGVHYLHPARAQQPVDPTRPAILLYGPDRDGALALLGAEWFHADADQDTTTDDDRPTLFGRPFDGPMAGHDPMMPVHYDLHVWLFQANPAGTFAPWNPAVTC